MEKRPSLTAEAILTPDEMSQADRLTVRGGISGRLLMENAGQAVKSVVLGQYPQIERAIVLCGSGNNGGDGYVAARLLSELGVEAVVFRDTAPCEGKDAHAAAGRWAGAAQPLTELELRAGDVVIDALYGAGLRGILAGADAVATAAVNRSGLPVVAVDVPSGLDGLTGRAAGPVIKADDTVTFFHKKPGHLLYPGRALCGRLHVADIGISRMVLATIAPMLWENGPELFSGSLPKPNPVTHKYARGHVGVFSGGASSTGAARLAAMAAAKAGAGAVTVFAPAGAVAVHAAHLTSVMLRKADNEKDTAALLTDARLSALVIGPGFGRFEWLRDLVKLALGNAVKRGIVLDADVFSAFAVRPEVLFSAIKSSAGSAVLTPHDGEFARIFADIAMSDLSKVEKARAAAARSGATVLCKGADTVIAAPDGRAAINANGGPELAAAGSGDVLAGIIAGLLAQGMQGFEAACAGAWMHGEAGQRLGAGLTAEDLGGAAASCFPRKTS